MNNFLTKLFGPSWKTTLSGLVGGIAIAAYPVVQSAMNTQMQGIQVNWNNVLMGIVVAIGGYLAKDKNVSNSPTPLAVPQVVVPVTTPVPSAEQPQPAVLAKPVPVVTPTSTPK